MPTDPLDPTDTAEELGPTGPSVSMRSGLVAGLFSSAYLIIFYQLTGNELQNSDVGILIALLFMLTALVAILYSIYTRHKRSGDESVNLGKSIGTGVKTAITIGVVYGLARYLFFQFGAPEVVDEFMTQVEQSMIDEGIVGADLESSLNRNKALRYGPMSMLLLMLVYSFAGLFISVISSFAMGALQD